MWLLKPSLLTKRRHRKVADDGRCFGKVRSSLVASTTSPSENFVQRVQPRRRCRHRSKGFPISCGGSFRMPFAVRQRTSSDDSPRNRGSEKLCKRSSRNFVRVTTI